ncbi:MAG: hypothetical protein ACJAUD_000872 [Crocinitomicaceae bacterium]|jgi:hypothetical protein
MLVKSSKKGRFYILFFLLFGTLSSVIALVVSWFFIEMKYPNMDLESMFFAGNNTLLLRMMNVVSIVTLVFLVNHYKNLKENDKDAFSLARLIQNSRSRVWFFYLLTIVGITFFYGFFYFSDTTVVNDSNSLDMLLNAVELDGDLYYGSWLDGLIWYALVFVPLILISSNIITEKIGKFSLVSIAAHWKQILAFILIELILSALYLSIYEIIDSLLFNLIRIPFEEIYIPTFLALIVVIALNSVYFMLISKMAYFCFYTTEEVKVRHVNEENEDLLDQ